MKNSLLILATAVIALTSIGCEAAAPKVDDVKVQQKVIEIARQTLADKMAPFMYTKVTGVPTKLLDYKVTYDNLKSRSEKDADAKKVMAAIDKKVTATKLKLSGIKLDKANDKTQKSSFTADLDVGKNILMVMYTAQNTAKGLEVNVEGLKHIFDPNAPEDLSKVKAIPFTRKVDKQIKQYLADLKQAKFIEKDEFESNNEYKDRVRKAKNKACKKLFASGICSKVYSLDCRGRKPYLEYSRSSGVIRYAELKDLILSAGEELYCSWDRNFYFPHVYEVDFAGVVMKPLDHSSDYEAYKCPVNKARAIKKGLGNSWECNAKLWFKWDPQKSVWKVIKVFVIPVK